MSGRFTRSTKPLTSLPHDDPDKGSVALSAAEAARLANEVRELRDRDAVLSIRSAELVERMKELDCMLAISRASEDRRASLSEILQRIVQEMSKAWRFPERTRVRVAVGGDVHQTGEFDETLFRLSEPVLVRGRPVGQLEIGYTTVPQGEAQHPFLPEERQLLGALAARIGTLVELKDADLDLALYQDRLRMLAAELAATEERERRQIAQHLHDQIGQSLAVIKLRLDVLRALAADDQTRKHVDELTALVGQVIGDVRSLTYEVSPPILHELGLGPAMEWLGEHMTRRFRLPVQVAVRAPLPHVNEVVGSMIFRSVGELLTNVIKHAQASRAEIAVEGKRGRVRVEVADDGVGFKPDAARSKVAGRDAFGLFSIRERVEYLGGHMTVRSAPGCGTNVVLDLPTRVRRTTRRRGDAL